jgi:hypothetical protein
LNKGPKCHHCKDWGQIRRNCPGFNAWLAKKGNDDVISFIDESFFTYFLCDIWWIYSGATTHVTNSSHGFLGAWTRKRERSLKVADGRETKVEAVGSLSLVLHGGFTLMLSNVLYVPLLQRNLISVALLEDDIFECLFENNKCTIKFDNKVVGFAPRQGMLYMSSLNDFPMMNVCDVTNKQKRNNSHDNETSSKLWHYYLGGGRMERLIMEEILAPLDFTDLDHCADCIKGKICKADQKEWSYM